MVSLHDIWHWLWEPSPIGQLLTWGQQGQETDTGAMQASMGTLHELETAAEEELERTGEYEVLKLWYVVPPLMHHPEEVPHSLVWMVAHAAAPLGWEPVYWHVVRYSAHRGYFSFLMKKVGSPALPAWAFAALVGLAIAGVIIVAIQIKQMVVAASIAKIYNSCLGAGGDPETCRQTVEEAQKAISDAKKSAGGGILGDLSKILEGAGALVLLVLLVELARSARGR